MSIIRRRNKLKRLVDKYFPLEEKTLIDKHSEIIRVFDIRGSKHKKHPHKNIRVYISRKSLKHCVESRKNEFSKHHTEEIVLENIYFVIDKLQETITDFDLYEFEPPVKHFYTKDHSHAGKPSLRVLLELKETKLEIISIHFRKNKKKKE